MRWRLAGLTLLHWQHLDGEWVIYDEGTGHTLAADAIVAATLMALEGGLETAAEIVAQVHRDLEAEPGDELTEQILEALRFLSSLGLGRGASAMKLSALSESALRERLRHGDLVIRSGPFSYRIESRLRLIAEGIARLYGDYPLAPAEGFADFSLRLQEGAGLHRWWHRQVRVSSDGLFPFEPLPLSHAYPQLEWAMNWCVTTRAHQFLMLHAAVVERDGFAAILPAPPGSGKSTLCAGLVHRGWRLLSDETALVALTDGRIWPAARPISLKNESIGLMRSFAPQAVFAPVVEGTSKGAVTHMRVPSDHVARMTEAARPRWVIFPKYLPDAAATLTPYSRARSLLDLGGNSFNYVMLGRDGFEALTQLVSRCDCYEFRYSRLDDAVTLFDDLARVARATERDG